MQKYLLCLLMVAGFAGCADSHEPTMLERIQDNAKAQGLIAPKSADYTKLLPPLSEDFLQQTAKRHNDPILYRKQLGITYYFDAQGKLADKPQTQGFYRKIMGMTNNGLIVAQDFYQDTKTPQSAVFTIKQGGNEKNFDSIETTGLMILFLPDGSLDKMLEFDNGKQIGYSTIFKDHSILLTTKVGESKFFLYHPHSQILLACLDSTKSNELTEVVLFRPDGSAIFKGNRDTKGELHDVITWDTQGKPTKSPEVLSEAEKLFKQSQDNIREAMKFVTVTPS